MLIGIAPVVGPDLLAILCRMGHGDEIVLADANFPGETCGQRVVRADGVTIPCLLDGILPLFPLDPYAEDPLVMMAPVGKDRLDPAVEKTYRKIIRKHRRKVPPIARIERFAFYERARRAFAVVMTGDTAGYANLILKKGGIPSASQKM
jgi:L-fucose mutarotase